MPKRKSRTDEGDTSSDDENNTYSSEDENNLSFSSASPPAGNNSSAKKPIRGRQKRSRTNNKPYYGEELSRFKWRTGPNAPWQTWIQGK